MVRWLCALILWCGPPLARAADDAPSTDAASERPGWVERLRKRAERRSEKAEEAETAWTDACFAALEAPGDEHAAKCQLRAETELVNQRARWTVVQRQVDALGAPAATVQVLFATNRARTSPDPLLDTFDRETWYKARDADRLEYGVATVAVPEDHPVGALERDLRVVDVEVLTRGAFEERVRASLDAAGEGASLLTYVHGYNNSFTYSARRSAQLAHDLGSRTVPVLFSWPAHGGEWFAGVKYTYDENAAARSAAPFADVLVGLAIAAQGAPIHLFAHSLGSRVVADALVDVDRVGTVDVALDQLVFAAPDMDASVFARRYVDLADAMSDRVTIYCADDDRALKVSRGVHGGYDRLGSCRPSALAPLARAGLEVVDASRVYVDMLDHDKVADSPRLIADLRRVLRGVPASAPERDLVPADHGYELPP